MEFSRQEYWSGLPVPSPGDLPDPGIKPRSPILLLLLLLLLSRFSHVRLLPTPWTAAYQAPPTTGFSRQEYWSGLPLPSPLPHYIALPSEPAEVHGKWMTIINLT